MALPSSLRNWKIKLISTTRRVREITMKNFLKDAKVVISKAIQAAACRFEIARAVATYTACEVRLKKLHPVRDAQKRETVSYKARANQLACELATKKLSTI